MAREATTVHRNGKTCSMARNERRRLLHTGMARHAEWQEKRLLHTGMARHAEWQGMREGDYCTPEWQDMQNGKEPEEETTAHRNGKTCSMAREATTVHRNGKTCSISDVVYNFLQLSHYYKQQVLHDHHLQLFTVWDLSRSQQHQPAAQT